MKEMQVTMPVCGSITVWVNVEDDAGREEILEAACEAQDWNTSDGRNTSVNEMEVLEHVCQGAVCYAPLFHAEISEAD